MRKLKLEVQISVDGFIADKNGSMSWMIWPYTPEVWAWDKGLQQYHIEQTTSSDCILLSRNMAGGFHDFWEEVAQNPKDPRYAFAKPTTDMKKVVFSRKLKRSIWKNTEIAKGNYVDYIKRLKEEKGKDIICYGGATFISSLIEAELIDEFNLIINPAIVGAGLPVFNTIKRNQYLKLSKATAFECGIAVLQYQLDKQRST
ncbi:dihydrofolate reductase family protein [Chitinophaga niabensis]|uniref:Dihydrofolate reductase n=1 Tax=Chitinophaga niabensis TaxID=536979 RepID=A0A1N6IZN2_9BACT|nr:dihydrofolate reductase family protein [Chitinophaga niabensis]SIO37544.1 Dihydrofolate reductase [Chitinophaga niabensis]